MAENIEAYGLNSLRSIRENGNVINMADIEGATVRDGSLIGKVTIQTSATTLCIGSANLTSRHRLIINNDASNLIFISFDSAVTTATGWLIKSGEIMSFKLDPNEEISLYAVANAYDTEISLMELK